MNSTSRPRRATLLLAVALVLVVGLRADEPFARTREYDLQNARIHLTILPGERKVVGEVTHTLAPLRDGLDHLTFDSVDLAISSVTVGGKPAKFETTAEKLIVELERPAKAGKKLSVNIRYESKSNRKGVHFMLPDANYPNRRPHIWTQGEAEETRYYIPIYDYPNDLTTSEMIATVPKEWTTLSNGKLLSVKDGPNGMKTWTWRQSQPHAVYLISLVAGEFEEVKDTWRKIPVTYYVLRGEGARIRPTFERTRKMLDVFSEKFGVVYPWDKYAQIAVEEHFGGMEHTSATTLTAGSLLHPDLSGESLSGADDLISHELAHQWFGDLVTCKDWANLWINEGFASFAEILWDEAKYGKDEADYDIWLSRNQWLNQQRLFAVPIVTRDFTDSSQYGGNVYGKASLVIQMLRRELGDDNFFRSLRHFLEKNRHQNVVAADLVRAIEEATGRNVDAFFEQWIYRAGAPKFEVGYTYDASAHQVSLNVKQTQKVEGYVPLFRMPIEVEITTSAGKKSHTIQITKASETFPLPAGEEPYMVLFDPGNAILKALDFNKDWKGWAYQLRNADTVPDRADAARALRDIKGNEEVVKGLGEAARSDRFWGVRVQALRALAGIGGPAAQGEIESALANEQPWVRQVAVELMGTFKGDESAAGKLEKIYREDKAWRVRATALNSLAQQKPANGFDVLSAAAKMDSPDDRIRNAALRGLGALGDDRAVPIVLEWSAPGKPIPVRAAAISGLGQLDKKNKEITRKLASYVAEPYQGVRFSSLFALSQRGDPEALPALEALLASGELEGQIEQFARTLAARLKQQASQPAGSGPASPPPF